MKPITVTHDDPGNPLSVTVSEATTLQGIGRTVLITEAMESLSEGPKGQAVLEKKAAPKKKKKKVDLPTGADWALFLLRRYTWPACKAAAINSEGFDHATLTFDEFCALPERFVSRWEEAALQLNPHWKLELTGDEQVEEKKEESASESE